MALPLNEVSIRDILKLHLVASYLQSSSGLRLPNVVSLRVFFLMEFQLEMFETTFSGATGACGCTLVCFW